MTTICSKKHQHTGRRDAQSAPICRINRCPLELTDTHTQGPESADSEENWVAGVNENERCLCKVEMESQ